MAIEFTSYVRDPYVVEAILITEENIDELAPWIGEIEIDEKSGKKKILVNKDLVKNVFVVEPGYYMTRFNGRVRCYSKNAFKRTFREMTPDIQVGLDAFGVKVP